MFNKVISHRERMVTLATYNAEAAVYAQDHRGGAGYRSLPPYRILEQIVTATLPTTGVYVDLGGGLADAAILVAQLAPAATVINTDFSQGMLAEAANNITNHELSDRIQQQEMDMTRISDHFSPGSVHLFSSITSALHLSKQDFIHVFLPQVKEALAADGSLFLVLKKHMGDGPEEEMRGHGNKRKFSFYNEHEIANILTEAGFYFEVSVIPDQRMPAREDTLFVLASKSPRANMDQLLTIQPK